MTDRTEILKLLKMAKESELEAIEQLMKLEAGGEKVEKPKKAAAKEEAGEDKDMSYDNMSAAELYKLCCTRGLSGKLKGRKKSEMIAVLNGAVTEEKPKKAEGKEAKKSDTSDTSDEDDWGEEEEEKPDYSKMTAKQLYDECVRRGIEVEKRKKAAEYIKVLEEYDSGSGNSDDEEEEDWEM